MAVPTPNSSIMCANSLQLLSYSTQVSPSKNKNIKIYYIFICTCSSFVKIQQWYTTAVLLGSHEGQYALSFWLAALAHWAGTHFGWACFLIHSSGWVCLGSSGSWSRLSDVDSRKLAFKLTCNKTGALWASGGFPSGSNPFQRG